MIIFSIVFILEISCYYSLHGYYFGRHSDRKPYSYSIDSLPGDENVGQEKIEE